MNELEVEQYFDTTSETYTRKRDIDEIESWPLFDEFLEEASTEGDRLLEIGCGDGLLPEYALEYTDVTEAHGLDISTEMLPDDGRAQYLNASATDLPLPFEPESFDFVVLSDVLHHLVGDRRSQSKLKAQAALIEAANLLKEGGHLVVKDISYRSPVGPDELTSCAIFYGLKYFTGLASAIDDQAAPGLLVSFYTQAELVEMLQQAGTTITRKEIDVKKQRSVPRRVLIGESACIRLYARKKPRTTETERADDETASRSRVTV
ncbi:class I SAM-dependent methyltransferase [Natribaculum luteum]|uniref:Class I SAM-dependent methyltransferase n=1 Tax=Natribaculum luteum TaxID=1586232 RepID=A0ABD5P6T0_9EURY|nr:class I SAM-dependent methyltransferase [Natribaculum luteum]